MKKFHKVFGWVTVLSENKNRIEVELESGEVKEIHKDFLFNDETSTCKKSQKSTEKDLRAIAHTMSAVAVKEHINDIDGADTLFWVLWKVFKHEGKWSKSLKSSDFAIHFNK